jgi:hypothetical protein
MIPECYYLKLDRFYKKLSKTTPPEVMEFYRIQDDLHAILARFDHWKSQLKPEPIDGELEQLDELEQAIHWATTTASQTTRWVSWRIPRKK